jgi:hypothetical protein
MSAIKWIVPGFLIEAAGIMIFVYGILAGSFPGIFLGIGLIIAASLVHVIRFMQARSAGSGSWDIRTGTAGTAPAISSSPGVLYSDRFVSITGNEITFHHYSFPLFAKSRTLSLSDVDHIDVMKPTVHTGKWRIAGSGDFRTWYPLDRDRPSRDRIFHAILRIRGMNIGFTVEDPVRATRILKQKGLIGEEEVV